MTSLQNQGLEGLNVLRDQGLPNTIGGIGAPTQTVSMRMPLGALAAGLAVIAALIFILALRLA
jgi:hypothetical protein